MADGGLGTQIKRARERKRWSQQQLADALGVDRKTVDNWEHSRTRPRSSIGALQDALAPYFSTDGDEPAPPTDPRERELWALLLADGLDPAGAWEVIGEYRRRRVKRRTA